MLSTIKNKLSPLTRKLDIHTLEVAKKSSASMVVKVAGMAAGLAVSIFLGRTLGAEGLGIINLANRIVSLLLVLTMFGFDNVLIKHIAIAFENKNWQKIGNAIYTSTRFNGLLALIISISGILITPWLVNKVFHEPNLKVPLFIALAMIIPQTYSRIFAAGLSGFRKIWQSSLVNETLSSWVVGLCLLSFYILKVQINITNVAILYATGRIVVTTSILLYWKNLFSIKVSRNWQGRAMIEVAMPLFLVTATNFIAANADIIMLGWLKDSVDVGLYSVASRIALLNSFFLLISNASISPKLASLYAANKIEEMNKMVQRVTGGLIIIAIFSILLFIIFGNEILNLWGAGFEKAYILIIVLSIGQFINISTGCSGILLIMCGHEKIAGYISSSFVAVNLLLNYFFIKQYGALGAAISTAISISGENITKLIIAERKTKILTLPFIKK